MLYSHTQLKLVVWLLFSDIVIYFMLLVVSVFREEEESNSESSGSSSDSGEGGEGGEGGRRRRLKRGHGSGSSNDFFEAEFRKRRKV